MSEFTIWCDGSYRQQYNTFGVAWLRRTLPDRDLQERAMPLPPIIDAKNHGSDIAELMAFAYAVGSLPKGSKVKVHMDAQNIIDWLQAERLGKKPPQELGQAFKEALTAKKRMGIIEFVKTSDKNNENMGRAHVLSQTVSTPNKEDKRQKQHADQNSKRSPRPRGS